MKKMVRMRKDFPEMKLAGRKIGPFKEGEEVRLRPWEASIFEDNGLVEPVNDFSSTGLRKFLMAEEKSSQLEDLPPHFYQSVSQEIQKLQQRGEDQRAGEIKDVFDSLISLRIQKLAKMTVSSAVSKDLPLEESFLVNRLSHALRVWRNRLDQLFRKKPTEEVGAREKRFRRSIQGIVRHAADIQE